jgi:hypothetical protein
MLHQALLPKQAHRLEFRSESGWLRFAQCKIRPGQTKPHIPPIFASALPSSPTSSCRAERPPADSVPSRAVRLRIDGLRRGWLRSRLGVEQQHHPAASRTPCGCQHHDRVQLAIQRCPDRSAAWCQPGACAAVPAQRHAAAVPSYVGRQSNHPPRWRICSHDRPSSNSILQRLRSSRSLSVARTRSPENLCMPEPARASVRSTSIIQILEHLHPDWK